LILYSTAAAGTFYVGSAFFAFNNHRYHGIFSNYIPLGRAFLEFAEQRDWDTLTPQDVVKSWKATFNRVKQSVIGKTSSGDKLDVPNTPRSGPVKPQDPKQRVQDVISTLKTRVEKTDDEGGTKVAAISRHHAVQFSQGVEELVREAEAALAGKHLDVAGQNPEPHVITATPASAPLTSPPPDVDSKLGSPPQESQPPADAKIYDAPLPLGFEVPPGFTRPVVERAYKVEEPAHSSLPRIAQAVSETGSSKSILIHLASTVDELASFLESNDVAASEATNILEAAKTDLTKLTAQFEEVEDERRQLEANFDEHIRQYTQNLTEFQMEVQDKLDEQEEDFSKLFDEQRASIIHAYREKLKQELMAQNELINERYVWLNMSAFPILICFFI
jgi:mitofilin